MKHPINYMISKTLKVYAADYKTLSAKHAMKYSSEKSTLNKEMPNRLRKTWIYSDHYTPQTFYNKYKKGHLFNNWAEVAKAIKKYYPKARIVLLTYASIQKPLDAFYFMAYRMIFCFISTVTFGLRISKKHESIFFYHRKILILL